MSASLRFDAIDKVLGPLGGAVDNDVVLDQLQRLGLVERHIETYGMVYLPPCANALERLFATGVREHGYKGGLDEQAAGYDIVRGALSGGGFSIQRQGGLLNWRSALQVTIPVSETLSVPLALFHTRYSGSPAITAQYKREGYKGEEPAVKARVETMIQMAQALLPGHSQFGMPLIVGDFNIPADYLAPATGQGAPAQRKRAIGQRLHDGMAACGYLRHTQGAQLRAGHPLTTLKSFGALALGESGSQPYDGTYEPFDFAQRGAVLRSGVVAPGAIITDEAMQAPIRAAVVASDVAVDLDAGDSDDANSQNAGQDDNESASPGEFADRKVIDAVADQMARVYLAAARRLLRRIVEMEPWFQRVEGAAQRGRAKKTKYASGIPTPKLVQDIATLRDAAANRLPQLIAQREQWFVQSCIKQDTVDNYATALGSADPFDAYRALLASIAQQARACKIRDKTLDGLAGELEQIGTQLANLETRRDIRKAVAYRAVVSDHLPQIVEIDLEPGP
jgi:hypothetical protein